MIQIVPGSAKWFCRVEDCWAFTRHNIQYGYCDVHTRDVINGATLPSKLGLPPMESATSDPAIVKSVDDQQATGSATLSRSTSTVGEGEAAALDASPSSGAALIAAERQRQVTAEGWTAFHDDSEHHQGELVCAAICYAEAGSGFDLEIQQRGDDNRPRLWPWEPSSWKPSADLVRNLVKAGALIAAEIDRLQREGSVPLAASPSDPALMCSWRLDDVGGDSQWETTCGHAFEFNEDGPSANGIKFCGYCGKPISEERTSDGRQD